MAQRVLATSAAVAAVQRARVLLQGELAQQMRQVLGQGQVLASAAAWDGPSAADFRRTVWPRTSQALTRTVQALQRLESDTARIIDDILRAGDEAGPFGGSIPAAGAIAVAPLSVTPGDPGGLVTPGDDPEVQSALDYFHQHVGDDSFFSGGNRGTNEGILERFDGLTPAERDAFLRSLSDDDLRRWNAALRGGLPDSTPTPVMNGGRDPLGLSRAEHLRLANDVFSSASPDTLARIEPLLGALQPDPHSASTDSYYQSPLTWTSTKDLPLWGANQDTGMAYGRPDAVQDVNQGSENNCWFAAGLQAVALTQPDFIKDHIHANDNGTYTVTLYQDGRPVAVTVTDDVPSGQPKSPDWPQDTSYPYMRPGPNQAKWALLYEKAYAQLNGGYEGLDAKNNLHDFVSDTASTSMTAITGQPSQDWYGNSGVFNVSLSQLNGYLDQGDAITAGSWARPDGTSSDGVVHDHTYVVQSVDLNSNPPTVTLLNPWGPDAAEWNAQQSITLTEEQWHEEFPVVNRVQVPDPGSTAV